MSRPVCLELLTLLDEPNLDVIVPDIGLIRFKFKDILLYDDDNQIFLEDTMQQFQILDCLTHIAS